MTKSVEMLKAILIIGDNSANTPILFKDYYNKPGYLIIGDGRRSLLEKEIIALKGRIDSSTRIDISAHGSYIKGNHVIGVLKENIYTSKLFELLSKVNDGFPLYIHLWSCYAKLAAKDIKYLPVESVLVTHGSELKEAFTILGDFAFKHSLDSSLTISPYEDFVKNIAVYSTDSIFTTKVNGLIFNKIYNFKVNERFSEIIENPKALLQENIRKFTEFYAKIDSKYYQVYTENKDGTYTKPLQVEENSKGNNGILQRISDNFGHAYEYLFDTSKADAKKSMLYREASDKEANLFLKGWFLQHLYLNSNEIVSLFKENKLYQSFLKDNINDNSYGGITPILIASSLNYYDLVELLLKNKANPNIISNINGFSPLIIATKEGHNNIVKLLLKYKANPDILSQLDGATSLHLASSSGNEAIVNLLLKYKANPNIVEKLNGGTPLYTASFYNHPAIVENLLKNKANPDITNNNGETPLSYAARAGFYDIVQLLLKYKANPNITDIQGISPINIASYFGYTAIVKLLLEYNADPNIAEKIHSQAPLYLATIQGHKEIAELLIKAKADPNVLEENGFTPIAIAACLGKKGMIKTLLSSADTDIEFATDLISKKCADKLDIFYKIIDEVNPAGIAPITHDDEL